MTFPLTDRILDSLRSAFGLEGELRLLYGELDLNFRLHSPQGNFLVKLSRADVDREFLDFQEKILLHVVQNGTLQTSQLVQSLEGKYATSVEDENGLSRSLRVLHWIDGRLWSEVNPIRPALRESLGHAAGALTATLSNFSHLHAHRDLEWDLAQSAWTRTHDALFSPDQLALLHHFQDRFEAEGAVRSSLRKSVVHNDVNDQNILVSFDLQNPRVCALIDFGDAIFTQSIHDLAITLAYAIMEVPDPLQAARDVIQGYHAAFPLEEKELEVLYTAVGMRLVVSVTKAALNRLAEPHNAYHQISVEAAWKLLALWKNLDPHFVLCQFRLACGLEADPRAEVIRAYLQSRKCSLQQILPAPDFTEVYPIDLSVGSSWLGTMDELDDYALQELKFQRLQKANPRSWIAGGYMEPRVFYTTAAYRVHGNEGPEQRSMHLGLDVWMPAGTTVCAALEGRVIVAKDNAFDKDYGPTVILEHRTAEGTLFYSLYGHLSREGLRAIHTGDQVDAGACIGTLGTPEENGGWLPHLHFQFMTHMLGHLDNFDGVCRPSNEKLWRSICPDPALFFRELPPLSAPMETRAILDYRKAHLGKSLSISYAKPLHIVRGDGVWLIDAKGQRFLDTVNNVAHVGHENPRVVQAGTAQMAVLNTNTRYLHGEINAFAEALLATFPENLCVAHFVNSGSEANELAMRMARAYTGQKDMLAVEMGYHGNTAACIDISSYKFEGKGGKGKPEYTSIVPLPDAFRGLHRGPESGKEYAAYVAQQLDALQAKGRRVAAFICESIISCGGQIELPENYLKEAYALVRAQGGLCISDEVQVGCGRVGSAFWGFQLHGVVPDIVTIGKPLGNGHPLAAVVCTREVADAFANGMEYFNTFGGNPVSCAIGRAVLREIAEGKLQENAFSTGNFLKAELRTLSESFPILADVRGQGLFLGIELTDAAFNPLPAQTAYLANRMRERNILMSTDGRDHNVLKIKPPIVFSKQDAELLLENLRAVLQEDFMKI